MLRLQYTTPEPWASQALSDLPRLLADHEALEIKAALMAESIIAKWGHRHPKLVAPLNAVANEERQHAATVAAVRENHPLAATLAPGEHGKPRHNPYVRALRRRIVADGAGLLDLLLTSALIEGRSAERFRLLARAARATPLGGLYEDFYASEVGHYVLFTDLASDLFGVQRASERLDILAQHEAQIVATLPAASRMH